MELYKSHVRPLVEQFDSETGHHAARTSLGLLQKIPFGPDMMMQLFTGDYRYTDPQLAVKMGDLRFDNPVMVGAGWDKNGEAVDALYALGFSGVEVGTVLLMPQTGNPKPRQFRIGDGVSLNRLGFNSPGVNEVIKNMKRYALRDYPIGGSVGKNKEVLDKDAPRAHARVTKRLLPYVDYIAINVSSPNTPNLRNLQGKELLRDNVQAVKEVAEGKPVLVKAAPDLTKGEMDDVAQVVRDEGCFGVIIGNTTINQRIKEKYGLLWGGKFDGGLAGDDPDFRQMSNDLISHIYRNDKGLYIIGVGGVKDGPTALEKIEAGAHVVQIVTGLWSQGPFVARNTNRWLHNYVQDNGVSSIQDLRGIAA